MSTRRPHDPGLAALVETEQREQPITCPVLHAANLSGLMMALDATKPLPRGRAVLSPDGLYRYELSRIFSGLTADWEAPAVLYVGLNPSTADALKDDTTVRRWIGFTRGFGYRRFLVGNLYAWRATRPKDLWAEARRGVDIVGPYNDANLANLARRASVIVCCWGRAPAEREQVVLRILRGSSAPVMRFDVPHLSVPYPHPLRLRKTTPLARLSA